MKKVGTQTENTSEQLAGYGFFASTGSPGDSGDLTPTIKDLSFEEPPSPERSSSDKSVSSGTYTDHTDNEQVSDNEKESGDARVVSYVTWEEIINDRYDGINYKDNFDRIIQEYKQGYEKKELHIKPPKSKKVSSSLYDSAVGSARSFLEKNLSDLVDGVRINELLKPEQKQNILDLVQNLGIHYQLEIGAYIKSCAGSSKFDTLFYQKSVGPIIREVVKSSSSGNFEIRERSKYSTPFETVSSPGGGILSFKGDDASEDPDPMRAVIALSAVKAGLGLALRGYEEESCNNTPYSNVFKDLKVAATISVASTCAPAKDYNTSDGLKSFLEGIDPGVKSLSLVRVDTAHTWTELQCILLKEAAACNDYSFFMSNTIKKLFKTIDENDETTVVKDACGLAVVDKKIENGLWAQANNNMIKAGQTWHDKYFKNVSQVLVDNHFADENSHGHGFIREQPLHDNDWKNYKYESALSKQSKRLKVIKNSYKLVQNALDVIIDRALSAAPSEGKDSTENDSNDQLTNFCLTIALLEHAGFMKYFLAKCAEVKASFNEDDAKVARDLARKAFIELFNGKGTKSQELKGKINKLIEGGNNDCYTDDKEQDPTANMLLEHVYRFCMFTHQHKAIKDADEADLHFAKTYRKLEGSDSLDRAKSPTGLPKSTSSPAF